MHLATPRAGATLTRAQAELHFLLRTRQGGPVQEPGGRAVMVQSDTIPVASLGELWVGDPTVV